MQHNKYKVKDNFKIDVNLHNTIRVFNYDDKQCYDRSYVSLVDILYLFKTHNGWCGQERQGPLLQ